jgi:hypothetical protein
LSHASLAKSARLYLRKKEIFCILILAYKYIATNSRIGKGSNFTWFIALLSYDRWVFFILGSSLDRLRNPNGVTVPSTVSGHAFHALLSGLAETRVHYVKGCSYVD